MLRLPAGLGVVVDGGDWIAHDELQVAAILVVALHLVRMVMGGSLRLCERRVAWSRLSLQS